MRTLSKPYRQHRGKRNPQKKRDHQTLLKQRKLECKIVYDTSFNDTEKQEIICTVTPEHIKTEIKKQLSADEPLMNNDPVSCDGLIISESKEHLSLKQILMPQYQGVYF